MLRVLRAFFPAVFAAYVLASLLATQVVLQDLVAMGVEVDFETRLRASLHDLLGLASTYLLLVFFYTLQTLLLLLPQ